MNYSPSEINWPTEIRKRLVVRWVLVCLNIGISHVYDDISVFQY